MSTPEQLPASDAEFLDDLFDLVLERVGERQPIDLDAACAQRPRLRARAALLLASARRLVERHGSFAWPPSRLPEIAGLVVERELGRGGMGTVYVARDAALGDRRVAVKVLRPGWSPAVRERFLNEARAMARVRHPHIVVIHDVRPCGDGLALVTELVEGQSLAQRLAQASASGAPRGDADADFVRIAAAIARALRAVHRAGLVHRDVKPSNILLRRDGTPLLADFGLARDAEQPLGTRTGQFVGTPAYAAPEQLRGELERVDGRADVFGLGATLYHCLAGVPPAGTGSVVDVLRRHEQARVPRLRQHRSGIARDLETIVAKAIDPLPERRYPDADALADDLERLLALRPIRARAIGPAGRAWRFARRRPALTSLIATAGVALPLLLLGVLWVTPIVRAAQTAERRQVVDRALAEAFVLLSEASAEHATQEATAAAALAFEAASRLVPGSAEVAGGLALLYLRRGDARRALEVLAATGADAEFALARLRARALRALGRDEEAARSEREAPPPRTPFDYAIAVLGAAEPGTDRDAEAKRARGEALASLRRALLGGEHLRLLDWELYCQASLATEDTAHLADWATAMARRFPDAVAAHYRAGVTLRQVGRPAESMSELQEAMRLAAARGSGQLASVCNSLGNALTDASRFAEAEAMFRRALRLRSRYADAQYNLANCLCRANRFAEAVTEFDRAIALGADAASAYIGASAAAIGAGAHEQGLAFAEQALAVSPRSPRARWNHALACFRLRRFKDAEASVRVVVGADDQDFGAWLLLARSLRAQGRFAEAGEPLAKAARGSDRHARQARALVAPNEALCRAKALLDSSRAEPADATAVRAAARMAGEQECFALAADLWHLLATCSGVGAGGEGRHDAEARSDLQLGARAAACAASGHGEDAPSVDAAAKQRHLAAARERLRALLAATLAAERAGGTTAAEVTALLQGWLDDSAFACVRDDADPLAVELWQRVRAELQSRR